MKNLIIPIDHLVMLAELDDKDAGLMALLPSTTILI